MKVKREVIRWPAAWRGEHVDLGPVGQAVELVVARTAEAGLRRDLARCTAERDTARQDRDRYRHERDALQKELDRLHGELHDVRQDIDVTRRERDDAVMTSKRHARDLVATAEALEQAAPIHRLCGALLQRFQPRIGRPANLRFASASARQVQYWREQYDRLEVPEAEAVPDGG